jgi:HD superfamily phosphohydrolase
MDSDSAEIEIINLIRMTGLREHELLFAKEQRADKWEQIEQMLSAHKKLLEMGEIHTRQKAIQDPVHGAIILDPWELDLISSWEMLRLRFVMQLGPAHIVYPGATHTRFQHCLGTDFLAQKCIRVVNYCEDLAEACFIPLSQLLDEYHQRIFRAAALLHDVGHPPTSHTIEFALESWSGLDHTDLGVFLIQHSGITEILEKHDIEPRVVVDVLKRRTKDPVLGLISDFLDSPLDLDKTDYLIRDAHFSGVQLGIFPAERVLLTNRVVKTSEGKYVRAYMLKALHSLESLILSRNWMFSDLYLHHAVRVASALISKATFFRLREENLSKNECIGLFTRMTDADLYRWLEESPTGYIREYASRIRYRRLFKVVLSRPISAFEKDAQEKLKTLESDIQELIDVELALNENPGNVIIDVVIPELGEALLSRIPLLVGGEHSGLNLFSLDATEEGKPLIKILNQQKRTIPAVRVYSSPEIAGKVRVEFDRMFPTSEGRTFVDDDYDLTEI